MRLGKYKISDGLVVTSTHFIAILTILIAQAHIASSDSMTSLNRVIMVLGLSATALLHLLPLAIRPPFPHFAPNTPSMTAVHEAGHVATHALLPEEIRLNAPAPKVQFEKSSVRHYKQTKFWAAASTTYFSSEYAADRFKFPMLLALYAIQSAGGTAAERSVFFNIESGKDTSDIIQFTLDAATRLRYFLDCESTSDKNNFPPDKIILEAHEATIDALHNWFSKNHDAIIKLAQYIDNNNGISSQKSQEMLSNFTPPHQNDCPFAIFEQYITKNS